VYGASRGYASYLIDKWLHFKHVSALARCERRGWPAPEPESLDWEFLRPGGFIWVGNTFQNGSDAGLASHAELRIIERQILLKTSNIFWYRKDAVAPIRRAARSSRTGSWS
jgi:hypothetical protein